MSGNFQFLKFAITHSGFKASSFTYLKRCMMLFGIVVMSMAFISHDVIKDFKDYFELLPVEKVYLHLNKELYTTGETIWFKAYLVDGSSHEEDTLSGTLYVDLINVNNNKVICSKMLQMKNGMSNGEFFLADTLPSSPYQVRAYTNWMRNFQNDFYHSPMIPVYNLNSSNADWELNSTIVHYEQFDTIQIFLSHENTISDSSEYELIIRNDNNLPLYQASIQPGLKENFRFKFRNDIADKNQSIYISLSNALYNNQFAIQLKKQPVIKFFPEGGSNIVAGLVNVVAFEASDNAGNPIIPEGDIIDQDSIKITPIKEIHEGRGLIIFNPEIGSRYTAKVRFGEQWHFFPLPEVQTEGVVLSAFNSHEDDLNIKIATQDPNGIYPGPFTLIGQVRGQIYWHNTIELDEHATRFKIPKSVFPTGVLQLTLFNQQQLPILERLVFINHQDQMKIGISTSKSKYKPREKVEVNLNVTDADGYPVAANLSATVLDHNQIPMSNHENIISYLLLSSDVVGPIDHPYQYFRENDRKTQLALDLLMLTRGWRRLKWEQLLKRALPVITFMPKKGFDICGVLSQPWNNKPVSNRLISVLVIGQEPDFLTAQTDSEGRFCLSNLNFEDTVSMVFQTMSKRGNKQNFHLKLDSASLPQVNINVNKYAQQAIPFEYLAHNRNRREIELAYLGDSTPVILDEITVEGSEIKSRWEELKIYGEADFVLQPDELELKRFVYITDYIRSMVPGMNVRGFGADATLAPISGLGISISEAPKGPLILLDGIPLEGSLINTIRLNLIQTIEVVKTNTNNFGSRGIYGVVALYTKTEMFEAQNAKGIMRLTQNGYAVPREYYTPNYDIPDDTHIMPDLRSHLFWEPGLQTDADGITSFSFFNSDLKSDIKIIVEGISEDGTPGFAELIYKVE